MELVTKIYQQTAEFPDREQYGLTSQIRRSGVSVPSNIAEGYGRNSTTDYIRFLRVAMGSLYELETQLEIAANVGLLTKDNQEMFVEETMEIGRMLGALISSLSKRNS
jgi:four helix bundle protein